MEEMAKYIKSVLDNYDVQSAMTCTREEGREEEKISIMQKCLQKNIPVEDIAFLVLARTAIDTPPLRRAIYEQLAALRN